MHESQGVTIGQKFPQMSVETTLGKMVLPDAYQGKWFILFSHPSDFTPVCTTEFVAFQQWKEYFQKMNTELIGLSIDQVYSHLKWVEEIERLFGVKITFPIIADPLGTVAKQLGMLPGKENSSKTVRAVFVVDDQGMIRQILLYPPEIGRNIGEIWRSVHALQTASVLGVALPENWPNNSIIGANVILPPPASEAEIRERLALQQQGDIQCYDWWFCYKKIQ